MKPKMKAWGAGKKIVPSMGNGDIFDFSTHKPVSSTGDYGNPNAQHETPPVYELPVKKVKK